MIATSYVDTQIVGRYYAPGAAANDTFPILSESTALALPAFLGVERDPTHALYLGTIRDCQGRAVSNAVAGASFTSSTFTNAGGETYYYSAGSTSLPVRHSMEPVINSDGLFMVLNVPPGAGLRIQVWGFRTIGELQAGTLTLLAEIAAPSQAGEVISTALEPHRI
jgi:hypothetical protein